MFQVPPLFNNLTIINSAVSKVSLLRFYRTSFTVSLGPFSARKAYSVFITELLLYLSFKVQIVYVILYDIFFKILILF